MILVSVILVVRNEEKHVEQCLRSIEKQFSDFSTWELIVVDGLSTDGTLLVVKTFLKQKLYKHRIIENPHKILASGWNIGIESAVGEYVIRPDGHSTLGTNYIKTGINTLKHNPDITAVGGVLSTKAKGFWGEIIKEALSTRIGVGNSSFRTAKKSSYTDTAVYALYRRNIFEKAGLFNESLIRHQDNEMHQRISAIGGTFFLNVDMKADYYCRDSVPALLSQMFNIGKYLPPVIIRGAASLRHVLPFSFYTILISTLVLAALGPIYFLYAGLTMVGIYIATIAVEGVKMAVKKRKLSNLLIITIIPTMHLFYAVGTLVGFLALIKKQNSNTLCQ